jgi:FAD/FMN-containing dehydrogenase
LPVLHGELVTDDVSLAEAADDFGHVVSHVPRAVLRPGSAADVAAVVRACGERRLPVAARGRGHSSFGQAQVSGGVVVDMRTLGLVHRLEADRVIVDAGSSWRDLVEETVSHGLTPPVLTDYLGLSVGGTLSAGGIGGTTHQYGVQTDTVLELEVVTGEGAVHTCAPDRNRDLFHAVLAGHGQCGIIIRATLRLVPAPERVRQVKVAYPSATALVAAQRRALHEGRFDHLGGAISATGQGWQYVLEGVRYYSAPHEPSNEELVAGLGHLAGTEEFKDLSYLAFADRLGFAEKFLRDTGEWTNPHPTWNAFLPDSTTDEFIGQLADELVPDDLGGRGLLVVYPVFTGPLHTPLFRVPDEPVVFLVELARYGPAGDEDAVRRMIAGNRSWYERARALGGVAYPVGTIPLTTEDWRAHFGAAEPGFTAAKHRFDPAGILSPGQGIFPDIS